VQLFVDRAQAVQADFQVTRTNAAAIAGLCARLEGLPLALELAAARAGVLTPAQMLERLGQRFGLLASPQRGVTPRHRSLRAALEWSYQLLSPELQRFFARLSVFQGGWTLEAAEVVWEEPRALDYLQQLRESTLVQAAEAEGEMRFRLLETLREYGAEQLGAEERTAAAHRHASYYLVLAERAEPEMLQEGQLARVDRLARDFDNLRVALAWLEASGRIQEALRLGAALREFWYARGDLVEWLERLKRLLGLPGAEARTSARAKALNKAGAVATFFGDFVIARPLHEESLTIGRELGDQWNIAFSLTGLGTTLAKSATENSGNLEAARLLFEEGLTIWREIGWHWGIAYALTGLGIVARGQRDYRTARAIFEECLRIRSERGDRWSIALTLLHLGYLARSQGDYEEARSRCQGCLALAQELRDRAFMGEALFCLGHLAYLEGDLLAARALLEESLPLAREVGDKEMSGWILTYMPEVAGGQGDADTASIYLDEAVSIWKLQENNSAIAESLRHRGRIARQRGDLVAARRCFADSLARWQVSKDKHRIALCLEGLAAVATDQGEAERACRLFGAAAALRETSGRPLEPVYRGEYERQVAAVRDTLGEKAFAADWAEGRAMTLEQAAAYALQ
jgi:tetratricopeptide (TPR) repeat protein